MFRTLFATLALAFAVTAHAQDEAADNEALVRTFLESLQFKDGQIALPEANATLKLGTQFRFLDARDAERVLSELWGNPPGSGAIGMLVPSGVPLSHEDSWAVVITYNDDGYVSDDEASSIDYDEILAQMKQATSDANEDREAAGYGRLDLVGWATKPHYDAAANKIYWAKELKFAGAEENSLNYDIRVLGRGGYLSLNAVASMSELAVVERDMRNVLEMVEFDAGQRYADFDESTDKIAGYGLAALVGGAVAAKAGLFGKLAALLIAGKKLVIPLLIGFAALFARFYKKKKAETTA